MIWLLILCVVTGCGFQGSLPISTYAPIGRANVAVIVGTLDLDRPKDLDTFPDNPPGSEDERGSVGAPSKPVVTAYAPAWRPASRDFLEWYHSLPEGFWEDKSFTLTVIEDKEPPSGDVPLFVWDAAQTSGWYGIESLIETVQKYPPQPLQFEGKGKREKKNHDLVGVTASIPGAEILPLILGDETTINRRSAAEQKIPLGYGAVLTIPGESSLTIRQEGDETVAEFTSGAPQVLLPVLRRLWPVGVDRLRLREGMLTVELDGWKDIQVRVLP